MPRINSEESKIKIFPWEQRWDHISDKSKSESAENPPSCAITMKIFKEHHTVVLHIPCRSLFLMEAFQTAFNNRKVCPVCNVAINDSDLKMLLEKIKAVITDLQKDLASMRVSYQEIEQTIENLTRTDKKETTVSFSKASKTVSSETKLKNIVKTIPSSQTTLVLLNEGLKSLSEEISELEKKIYELKSLENRVVFENFYSPYISKVKMVAAFAILSFVSYYLFRATVNYCATIF